MQVKFDQFYTKYESAKFCVDILKDVLKDKKLSYIEPSSGRGDFAYQIPCRSFDIDPKTAFVNVTDKVKNNLYTIKVDFLTHTIDTFNKDTCIFGNPPFGNKNDLSKAFIKKSIELTDVKVIAFVLPECFDKYSMQKVFPRNWKLVSNTKLPKNSFYTDIPQKSGSNDYHVPCTFQVWVKDNFINLPDLREVTYGSICNDFSIVKKSEYPDFFIFGAAPAKIISPEQVTSKNRGYYVKSFINTAELYDRIQSVIWKDSAKSSVSGGVAWFTKDEIIKLYIRKHQNDYAKHE